LEEEKRKAPIQTMKNLGKIIFPETKKGEKVLLWVRFIAKLKHEHKNRVSKEQK